MVSNLQPSDLEFMISMKATQKRDGGLRVRFKTAGDDHSPDDIVDALVLASIAVLRDSEGKEPFTKDEMMDYIQDKIVMFFEARERRFSVLGNDSG